MCKSCKNSNKDTNIDIEDVFGEDVYDSNDEYNEYGYDSDEEENGGKLFQTMRVSHEKKIMTKAKRSKICFWKTDSFMNIYWDLNF